MTNEITVEFPSTLYDTLSPILQTVLLTDWVAYSEGPIDKTDASALSAMLTIIMKKLKISEIIDASKITILVASDEDYNSFKTRGIRATYFKGRGSLRDGFGLVMKVKLKNESKSLRGVNIANALSEKSIDPMSNFFTIFGVIFNSTARAFYNTVVNVPDTPYVSSHRLKRKEYLYTTMHDIFSRTDGVDEQEIISFAKGIEFGARNSPKSQILQPSSNDNLNFCKDAILNTFGKYTRSMTLYNILFDQNISPKIINDGHERNVYTIVDMLQRAYSGFYCLNVHNNIVEKVSDDLTGYDPNVIKTGVSISQHKWRVTRRGMELKDTKQGWFEGYVLLPGVPDTVARESGVTYYPRDGILPKNDQIRNPEQDAKDTIITLILNVKYDNDYALFNYEPTFLNILAMIQRTPPLTKSIVNNSSNGILIYVAGAAVIVTLATFIYISNTRKRKRID